MSLQDLLPQGAGIIHLRVAREMLCSPVCGQTLLYDMQPTIMISQNVFIDLF